MVMFSWKEKDRMIQEMEEAGSNVKNIRDYGDQKSYSLYVKDPDGNLWELWSAA
jgi:predicted lactoylglutathione lyase